MVAEDLLREICAGESKTLELKRALSPKRKNYVKTIIAFANSAGGKLVIGVGDNCEVVGVVDARLVADTLANAIDDLCEPQVVPSIWVQEIDGHDVVVTEVRSGAANPLSSQGKDSR